MSSAKWDLELEIFSFKRGEMNKRQKSSHETFEVLSQQNRQELSPSVHAKRKTDGEKWAMQQIHFRLKLRRTFWVLIFGQPWHGSRDLSVPKGFLES